MTFTLLAALASALSGFALGYLHRFAKSRSSALALYVEKELPGIDCGQCGYSGCGPYAAALARGKAPTTLCPPGGIELVARLSDLLGTDPTGKPEDGPAAFSQTASIKEADCIGCALCTPACPFDAIVGAPLTAHSVVEWNCTGCELCLPACPVDCITMQPFRNVEPILEGIRA